MNIYLSEYFGTLLLILLGNGVVAGVLLKKSKSENAGWLVINLGWGLAVVLSIYVSGAYSGAHLNPAVTIGLAAAGKFSWKNVLGYCVAQLLGAISGAILVWLHYMPHWKETPDTSLKLAVFCTAPAISKKWANLFSEISGTFILLFAIMAIGSNKFADGLNPLVVGALIVSIGISLGGTTGYAINPARDLGPRIAHWILPIAGKGDSNWAYAWVPVAGPIIGGLFGTLTFNALYNSDFNFLFIATSAIVAVIGFMSYVEDKKN